MRIALLEDDANQTHFISRVLGEAGHSVRAFATGRKFLADVAHESYDVLVLDWELPDISGLDVLRNMREQVTAQTPVLFLTHRDSEHDIVQALQAGADDYLIKPPRERELIARVSALARRGHVASPVSELSIGPYQFDLEHRTARLAGNTLQLTQREFDLAVFLFRNVGKVLSRAHIMESVWGRGAEATTRTVDTHMSRLRTELKLAPENGLRLTPVYGYGYRLETVG
jgi:two-component system, OmpR family, response regulator RegX3